MASRGCPSIISAGLETWRLARSQRATAAIQLKFRWSRSDAICSLLGLAEDAHQRLKAGGREVTAASNRPSIIFPG